MTTVPVGPVRVAGAPQRPGDHVDLVVPVGGLLQPEPVRLSLLVVLPDMPGVDPAWSPAAVSVPPAVALRWTALGPDGSETAVAVDDTTGGLRRSGLLGLTWPGVWDALGAEGCRLRATVVDGSYTEPVRIVAAYPNAVLAENRVPAHADVTGPVRSLLTMPWCRVQLGGTAGRCWRAPVT